MNAMKVLLEVVKSRLKTCIHIERRTAISKCVSRKKVQLSSFLLFNFRCNRTRNCIIGAQQGFG